MSNCNVTFWKDTDDKKGTGHSKTFDGPQNVPDLNEVQWGGETRDDMKDDASWVDTGSQAWVRIYSKASYQGRSTLIGPGQHVNLKTRKDDDNEDDMNDTVESFQLYDHKPDVDTAKVIGNFVALYPGAERDRDNNLYNSDFYSQDSHYKVFDPQMVPGSNRIDFAIDLEHAQGGSNDRATATFSMDFQGDFLQSIQVNYDIAGAPQVPDWMIKLVDGAIDVADIAAKAIADGAEIVISDGAGVIATVPTNKVIDITAKALTFCVDNVNTVLKGMFKLQDNGGTMYFSAVASHSIARLVRAYYEELFGPDQTPGLSFSDQAFLTGMGVSKWSTSGYHNPYVEFNQGSFPYRCFAPDNSFLYARGGAVSSFALGASTSGEKDDHLILQATYDPKGRVFSVAAAMDVFMMKDVDGYEAPTCGVVTYNADRELIHITPGGDVSAIQYDSVEAACKDLLLKSMSSVTSKSGVEFTDQQRTLVDASLRVLNAITSAMH
ncbi:MAG TPA: hypothetical protein VNP72_03645 [Longimicrobium sp.]|nr:hypothetical protein [Longimicrobium sp.]